MSDPTTLSLTELAGALRAREFSSVELTGATLKRIDALNPKLNAFVSVEPDNALKFAKDADARLAREENVGPLHGVPLAHKDMYYTKGMVAGCGSKIRKDWVAPATSTAIARLEAAGTFRIGALHMAEFAYGPTGHNEHLGPARNPFDVTRITGGSSSGSGSAVGARLVSAALGSDTGGSIRLPAHFCGVTGMKPSYGRVSRANAMPLSHTLDSVGPLAQSADDCALIMEAIMGPDPLDPITDGALPWDRNQAARAIPGLKIGVPSSFYVDDLEADVAAALDATIKTCEKLGVSVTRVSLPDQMVVSAAALIVLAVEAASVHIVNLRTRPQDFGAQVRSRLENGLAYSAIEYLEALRWRGPALAAHLDAIGEIDVVIAPVSRAAAPTIAETDVGGGPGAESAIQAITRFMRSINYLGLPALVVPSGHTRSGLPIGMQLIGRPFGDETVIALGRAFQAATDHHSRLPALS